MVVESAFSKRGWIVPVVATSARICRFVTVKCDGRSWELRQVVTFHRGITVDCRYLALNRVALQACLFDRSSIWGGSCRLGCRFSRQTTASGTAGCRGQRSKAQENRRFAVIAYPPWPEWGSRPLNRPTPLACASRTDSSLPCEAHAGLAFIWRLWRPPEPPSGGTSCWGLARSNADPHPFSVLHLRDALCCTCDRPLLLICGNPVRRETCRSPAGR